MDYEKVGKWMKKRGRNIFCLRNGSGLRWPVTGAGVAFGSRGQRLESVGAGQVVDASSQGRPEPCRIGAVLAASHNLVDLAPVIHNRVHLDLRFHPGVSGIEFAAEAVSGPVQGFQSVIELVFGVTSSGF